VGTEIDDTVVTAKVKSALLGDQDVKGYDIKVATRKGQVQLSGFVDNLSQVERAITVARAVEGVKDVENSMTLKDGKATVGNKVDDGITTARVKAALLAEPSIKIAQIAVVTRKGEVQLSGFVDSQLQMDLAISAAKAVEGVQSVINEMKLKQ
jgi:hyperosmotically inducible protein